MENTYIFSQTNTIKKSLPIEKAITYVRGALYDLDKPIYVEHRRLTAKEKEIDDGLNLLLAWLERNKDEGQKTATITIPAALAQ